MLTEKIPTVLTRFVALPALILCFASCGPGLATRNSPDRPATVAEISTWRKEHGFVAANETEIEQAQQLEKHFTKHRATSSDRKWSVVFQAGEQVGNMYHGISTTSTYKLIDSSSHVLVSAPSRISRGAPGAPIKDTQRAWFSPDGSKALVYEYIRDCNGPPPLAILFFKDPNLGGEWSVSFPDLGDTLNRPYNEGDHAECRGLLGEEILIRNTREGISKIRIDDLKDRHPFPFSFG
jgi:hypothetical protein